MRNTFGLLVGSFFIHLSFAKVHIYVFTFFYFINLCCLPISLHLSFVFIFLLDTTLVFCPKWTVHTTLAYMLPRSCSPSTYSPTTISIGIYTPLWGRMS
ncbi:hypothetical protein PAXRUDRAFT_205095 [Paxillus rubicundulus Ve08.2h10]|uniref:Uncharacterized protein n=1 Tax=Paxillus rubicundulus Ve08.2h10 TaxID=930991 RepID=A0A0D0E1F6_9AGAM|nr:hypothetical protein PAXRUDRAFT_205095 [Paxillus rubicundulus Ve08.2h10]